MKKNLLLLALTSLMMGLNAQTIFSEGFDDGLPEGWTMFNDNNIPSNPTFSDDAWRCFTTIGNPAPCMSSTSWFNEPAQADRWLITCAITLPAEGECTLTVDGYTEQEDYADGFQVRVCTTTPTDRGAFDPTPVISVPACGLDWQTYEGSLAAYAGQTIYIAVIENSEDKNQLYVDNIVVRGPNGEAIFTADFQPTLSLYPNPATDRLSLRSAEPMQEVVVTNLLGQEVRRVAADATELTIPLASLAAGQYVATVRTAQGVSSKQFTVNK